MWCTCWFDSVESCIKIQNAMRFKESRRFRENSRKFRTLQPTVGWSWFKVPLNRNSLVIPHPISIAYFHSRLFPLVKVQLKVESTNCPLSVSRPRRFRKNPWRFRSLYWHKTVCDSKFHWILINWTSFLSVILSLCLSWSIPYLLLVSFLADVCNSWWQDLCQKAKAAIWDSCWREGLQDSSKRNYSWQWKQRKSNPQKR
jgi:hypothetical protein